ncbi:DUF192 domain-containing protein [Phaeobacter sp. 11ANDIMAR09]|uniref:DUF192 domain-containing protein n=1 Tax=Phaeobacter sp. 11ANDIMAR09 TaxID=1225647 RepID=UPI0006C8C16D|nr:DUF192 domain-containing protein [Phaeobacter sp. 11ANDIMAR09]KPD11922.1 hypothetical protein AN476_13150 [Phaeobacter sp. 11ANDIMAR09]
MRRLRASLVAPALALLFGLGLSSPTLAADCRSDRVDLRGHWGQTSFSVEIADDEAERAQGLMFRESLARGAGMLFVYPEPQTAAFWMKNTLIPLDIIFLDQTGRVIQIQANAIPGDLTPLPGGDNVFAVLEINGGLAARYGISIGSEMRHKIFSKTSPIWPC